MRYTYGCYTQMEPDGVRKGKVLHSKAQKVDSSTGKWLVGCGNEADRTARQFGRPISTVISTRMRDLSEEKHLLLQRINHIPQMLGQNMTLSHIGRSIDSPILVR